jgi:hypothetical protein
MGTSDAFGGSKTWSAAAAAFADAANSGSSASASSAASAIVAALGRGSLRTQKFDIGDLLAGSRTSSHSSSSGSGRGDGATPSFARQSARGAAAIAAFDAWRTGDQIAAAACGIDLSTLDGLSGTALVVGIVDMVIGPAEHPDDTALRKSLIELLRKAEAATTQPSASDLLADLVASLAWETAAVNLTALLRSGDISPQTARSTEKKVRLFIRGAVGRVRKQFTAATPQALVNYASGLATRACRAMRVAGGQA